MPENKGYEYITMTEAENGVSVSFEAKKETGNDDDTFSPMRSERKEFVFQGAEGIEEAFKLFKALHMFNINKKKGENTQPVVLPLG